MTKGIAKISVVILEVAMMICVNGCAQRQVQRYGSVIGIKKENIEEYKRLHADCWPGVLKMIKKCNMRNYSICLGEVEPDEFYLFSYFEYTGGDFEKDMARIAADETTQKWWAKNKPLQMPLPTRKEGEHWADWPEVFHHDGPPSDKKISKRIGSIIGMPKDNILVYTQMHAAVWPGVLEAIDNANIRNYSIYLGEIEKDRYLLFSYLEYIGDDLGGDMGAIANEVTLKWWAYTDPLQQRLPGTPKGGQWKSVEQVFYMD